MAQLVVGGDDGSLTILIKLRTTCSSKNLHDVQDAQIHHGAALGIVNLGTLHQSRDRCVSAGGERSE